MVGSAEGFSDAGQVCDEVGANDFSPEGGGWLPASTFDPVVRNSIETRFGMIDMIEVASMTVVTMWLYHTKCTLEELEWQGDFNSNTGYVKGRDLY